MTQLVISDSEFSFNGNKVVCSETIKEAFKLDNLIVVLLDPGAKTDKTKKYQNLLAFDLTGKPIWSAELPESRMVDDAYWEISSKNPLVVKSFSSNDCEIDLNSGKILRTDFYK